MRDAVTGLKKQAGGITRVDQKSIKWSVLLLTDLMPLGAERQKELSTRQLPQLEACAQRLSDHVHCAKDGKNGSIHG